MNKRSLVFLVTIFLLVLVSARAFSAPAVEGAAGGTAVGQVIWTRWGTGHNALVDDGDLIWIATANGLVRWEKASGDYSRMGTADGLPLQQVYAGAVDGQGRRWFGGNGGLSRLDAQGEWTHFNKANSGLVDDVVQGIAVTANGDVWLQYGTVKVVSRLQADGSWMVYDDAQTAVAQAFDVIQETTNQNGLWTTTGAEVWTGYAAFDGQMWQDRRPSGASDAPRLLTADSQGRVYALDGADEFAVWQWDAGQWSVFEQEPDFEDALTTLAVDEQDGVWVGGEQKDDLIDYYRPVFGRLPNTVGQFKLDKLIDAPPSIAAILPTASGLYMSGPNWLRNPQGAIHEFADVPYQEIVGELIVDGHGTAWIFSTNWKYTGVLQTFQDKGTATIHDDSGELQEWFSYLMATATAENGDLWATWGYGGIKSSPAGPFRYYKGEQIDYSYEFPDPFFTAIVDIFSEDATHTWFLEAPYFIYDNYVLWSLDDQGTPDNFGDDTLTSIDTGRQGRFGVVAAQNGRLWFGDDTGVSLYQAGEWQPISDRAAYNLIPAQNGDLIVGEGGIILVIEAGGDQNRYAVPDYILNHFSVVRSTTRRNLLWKVAPDGAVWFWNDSGDLTRFDGEGMESFAGPGGRGHIEVDQNNHVWLINDYNLWRLSPRPDFQLAAGASTWLIAPHNSRDFAIGLTGIEGFAEPVALSVSGLPPGVQADFQPGEALPGQTAVLTLTSSGAELGQSPITIRGAAGDRQHEAYVTLNVVKEVHEMWLPAFFR